MPTNKKQTSPREATAASKLLRDPKTPAKVKGVAGSALSQAGKKKRSK